MMRVDTHELDSLAIELPKLGFKGGKAMGSVLREGGDDLRDTWKRNARETAGEHGRLYPESIEANVVVSTDFVIEIGPNPDKPQGGMSFEFGSSKQPPHLDGQRALDEVGPRIEKRIDSALGLLGF
jgi:hypothetical protein